MRKNAAIFLASLEHLLNNYEDFYNETLVPQVDLLMEDINRWMPLGMHLSGSNSTWADEKTLSKHPR
jgi:hypothetical protein